MSCNNCGNNWQLPATPSYLQATGYASHLDPVQGGCYPNCQFTAALSSLVWTNKTFIPNQAAPPYQFNFKEGAAAAVPVRVDGQLLYDSATGSPCGAIPPYINNKNIIWAALNEKAYAKFCQYLLDPVTYTQAWLNNAANQPNLIASLSATQWGGNPVTVLRRLTGCTDETRVLYPKNADGHPIWGDCSLTYMNNLMGPSYSTRDIYQFMYKNFCNIGGGVYKSKVPMVAWTYPDNTYLACGSASYSPTGIQQNHSYSILGVCQFGTPTKVNYIILRDPCGVDPLAAPANTPGTYTYQNKQFQICFGVNPTIIAPAIAGVGPTTSLTLSNNDGIFALPCDQFRYYFEALGWVY
ncbi:MAG: hypothetical protein LUO98_07850 [Methanoregula sp.]|nr:hypothetical protein [Methanoregula sp.]